MKRDKYPHHGDIDVRITPVDKGTDYFGFLCPCNKSMLVVTKLRQCIGGKDTGRLIINLECPVCHICEARKLMFYQPEGINIMVEQCIHKN